MIKPKRFKLGQVGPGIGAGYALYWDEGMRDYVDLDYPEMLN